MLRRIYTYGKDSTCENWHKQVDFQQFGWDIIGATGKCVSSVSHTPKLSPTALKIKLRHRWLSLTSTSKEPGCDCEIPGFPFNGWRRLSAKIPQRAQGGGRADDAIQSEAWKHDWIYSTCRKALLSLGSWWYGLKKNPLSIPHFQKKVWNEKKKKIRNTGTNNRVHLHSISCGWLFRSQGLFGCTNWVEVQSGHESKPVFPSTLDLMRATCRNAGSHSAPFPPFLPFPGW